MKKSVSKNQVLMAIKNFKEGTFLKKDRKLLAAFIIDRFKVNKIYLPDPAIELTYYIMKKEEEDLFSRPDGVEEFKGLIAEIAEAVYLELAKLQKKQRREKWYPVKNIITEETADMKVDKGADEFRLIRVIAYHPDTYKLSEKIHKLIELVIKKKYNLIPENEADSKKFYQHFLEISKELIINRFIDSDGSLLFPIKEIEKYLKKRESKEPRKIKKCRWCPRTAYVFHPKRVYCYRPSCRSSYSRKKSKQAMKDIITDRDRRKKILSQSKK